MSSTPGRNARLDALRGLAVIGLLPLFARAALIPSGAVARPQEGATGAALWTVLETTADETALWLCAISAGAAMALRRRSFSNERAWTADHRARMLTLLLLALAHALYVAPHSALANGAIAALLMSTAIREPESGSLHLGSALGAVPIAIAAAGIVGWAIETAPASADWTDRFARSNPVYEEWETTKLQGNWHEQQEVRQRLWAEVIADRGVKRDLWQIGAGIMIGLALMRRERPLRPAAAARLTAAGAATNAIAAVVALSPVEPGLGERLAEALNFGGGGALATGIAVLTLDGRWRLPATVAATGRNALTAFLTGTTVAAGIGHGWGLGLMGRAGAAEVAAAAVVTTICGVVAALLAGGRRGPAETLWRQSAGALLATARAGRTN